MCGIKHLLLGPHADEMGGWKYFWLEDRGNILKRARHTALKQQTAKIARMIGMMLAVMRERSK
jgi:hypothetical protein